MGHADIFISEILNSTDIASASGIDISKIPILPPYFTDADPEGSFIIIDPSSGKKQGDDCTINHYSVCDGIPIFDELVAGTFSPLETIKHAISIGLRRNTRLVAVEGVAYQSTLLFWFEQYCEQEGISGFEFVELSPKGQAKNNRIKRGLLQCLKGEIYLGQAVRSRVLSQIVDWNPLKINNTDDIIDPLGYIEEVMRDYGPLIVKNTFDTDTELVEASHHSNLALPF